MRLADTAWTDLDPAHRLLALPVGSCEQHGPHLPVDTDTRIAVALADALSAERDDVAVAPAVSYGSSGEHASFPGTLSIGQGVTEQLVVELVRSADAWRGVVLVNGHGGNAEPVTRALTTLRAEHRRVLAWWPEVPAGDLHAGLTETSLMLALDPAAVRMSRAEPGAEGSLAELLPRLRAGGVAAVSSNGVLGDPRGATAETGRQLLRALGQDLSAAVAAWVATLAPAR